MMRLLFLLPEYVAHSGGGIITFYRNLLPELAARGHRVRVIAGSGVSTARTPQRRVIDGVEVEELDLGLFEAHLARFGRYASMPGLRRMLAGAWAMWEQAGRAEEFDLVEAADWGLLFLPGVIEGGAPTVVQLHGSMGQIELYDPVAGEEAQGAMLRLIEAAGIARAAAVQAYSRLNASHWQGQAGRPVDCIRPAWAPLSVQVPGQPAPRTGRGLVVGRVQRWKGPQVLCDALRLLGPDAPAIDWVGRDTAFGTRGTTTAAHLREGWPELWGERVRHRPQTSFEEAARLQAAAAFVIVPSLWDTFNFTCVEAMAAGTPVICSRGAGASELIEDGVNGFSFESGDPASLAGALRRLLAMTPAQREAMGHAGRQAVLAQLHPGRICDRRIEAYAAAIVAGRAAPLAQDHWLRLASQPGPGGEAESTAYLDQLPLRSILRHAAGRVLRKVRG